MRIHFETFSSYSIAEAGITTMNLNFLKAFLSLLSHDALITLSLSIFSSNYIHPE